MMPYCLLPGKLFTIKSSALLGKKISLRDAYEDGGSVPKKFVIKYYEYCHKLP